MILSNENLEYFERGKKENPKFWERHGGMPDLTGKIILDVGCGHGSFCIDMALGGAAKVIGIDLNVRLIDFAKENLKENYSSLKEKVEFKAINLQDTEKSETYDYIISKDTFEHIIDLPQMLKEMKIRLKPGGRIISGFGPLYFSYYGDHKRTKLVLPWAHAIIPEGLIVKYLNYVHGKKINSVKDLGLNMYKLKDYERVFKESGLEIETFKVNENTHIFSKMMTIISKVPGMREFCSHNIYCSLRKIH